MFWNQNANSDKFFEGNLINCWLARHVDVKTAVKRPTEEATEAWRRSQEAKNINKIHRNFRIWSLRSIKLYVSELSGPVECSVTHERDSPLI